jgi:magnesium transporter
MQRNYALSDTRVNLTPNGTGSVFVFVNPDEEEKRKLIDEYKIDEHTLNSALDPDELSRLEFEPDHLAIIFKRPRQYSAEDKVPIFRVSSTGLFLFRDKLIVVLSEDVALYDGKLFSRVSSHVNLALRMIYRSIFHFLEHLKVVNMITDDLERKVNASMDNRNIIHLFGMEKSLVYYLNSISSNGVLIDKLRLNAAKLNLSPDEIEFVDDMIIENNQCYKQAEIYSNILASLMDARTSIVSNNLNVLMKNLTLITIGIMVPTLVVSTFSMNVRIPLSQLSNAFWIILVLALSSVVGFIVYWKHKKW